jgi:uncharacterized membrane protein
VPVIAAIDDTGYKVVLVVHIVAAIVGFAPAIAAVVTPRPAAADQAAVRTGRIVYAPALILTGLLGIVLVLMSDEAWEFSDGWVSAAFLVWIVIVGAYQALVIRGNRAGDEAGRRQAVLGSQIVAVLAVVMVYLMVFKPGA